MYDKVGWTFTINNCTWWYVALFFHSIEAELEYLKIAEDLEMYGISYFQIRVSDVHVHTTASIFNFYYIKAGND